MENMLRLTIGMLLMKLGGKVVLTKEDLEKLMESGESPMVNGELGDLDAPLMWYLERPGETH